MKIRNKRLDKSAKKEYYIMTVGHFENGRWVEEPLEQEPPSGPKNDLDERVAAAKASFGKGLSDLLSVGSDLLTTNEGRRHIGKTMDKASGEIMVTLEETAKKATDYISSLLEQKHKE